MTGSEVAEAFMFPFLVGDTALLWESGVFEAVVLAEAVLELLDLKRLRERCEVR